MNHTLINTTVALVLVTLAGWLLYVGSSLLLPFVLALMIWYLIDTLAKLIEAAKIKGFGLPRWLALLVALAIIGISLNSVGNLLAGNLTALASDAPIYQARVEQIIADVMVLFNVEGEFNIGQFLPDNILTQLATGLTGAVTTMLGSASIVFIYVIFLLLEQSTFDKKLLASFAEKDKSDMIFAMRQQITERITHYFGIKTGVSILTGIITGVFLHFIGLPYAVVFGLIAFLLNYIPTFGSLISVLLPGALALFLYDTLGTFIAIMVVLGLVQFMIGNLIEPRLLGTSLKISPLIILIMLAFWGSIWGVVGMILCVPLTVVIMVICAQFPSTRPIAVLLSNDGNVGSMGDFAKPED